MIFTIVYACHFTADTANKTVNGLLYTCVVRMSWINKRLITFGVGYAKALIANRNSLDPKRLASRCVFAMIDNDQTHLSL
jgi:hypothetical protein